MNQIERQQQAAKWAEDVKRRETAAKWIAFYSNIQQDYLRERIMSVFERTGKHMLKYAQTLDLTREIIEQIAVMFDNGLAVSIDEPAEGSLLPDMLDGMLRDALFLPTMDTIESYQKLCHKVLARPVWRDGKVEIDILLPDRVFVEQEPDNPKKAKAIYYSVGETTNSPTRSERKHIYIKLTSDEISTVKVGLHGGDEEVISSEPNPYGVIPVVEFQTEIIINSYWPERGNPLVDANALLDSLTTQFWYGFRWQVFSQAVMIGADTEKDYTISPDTPVMIESSLDGTNTGSFDFVNPNAAFDKAWKILNEEFPASIAQSYGLAKDVFRASASSFASGYHLRLAREPIVKRSMADREFYRPAIKKLIKLMMKTYDLNTADKQFGDAPIVLDFPEPRVDLDPLQQQQVRAMKTANGTWSAVRSLMEDNPDLDEDAALAEVVKIRTENQSITTTPLSVALADEIEA